MMRTVILLILLLSHLPVFAQFAPQAGIAGSTAIAKTDNRFVGWATGCDLRKGFMHIEDPSLGIPSVGSNTSALGPADNFLVSLGDSGVATLTFESSIYNGDGPDFAVFENGFPNPNNPEEAFLELAFVEVSSDGSNFVRFPASSVIPVDSQIPVAGVYTNARWIHNLAGKYISNYGTPFDLEELADTPGLDVNHITHIRLVDVIGSIHAHATVDKDGNVINDPYPTPIPTSGFDLDAVGALYMHGKFPAAIEKQYRPELLIYPNPVADRLSIHASGNITTSITDVAGRTMAVITFKDYIEIQMSDYQPGVYFIRCEDANGNKWVEKIIKQ